MKSARDVIAESYFDSDSSQQFTRMADRFDLLDADTERQLSMRMKRASLQILLALAEKETLTELQTFIAIAEHEAAKHDKTSGEMLNLHGLIDEIDLHLSFPSRLAKKRMSRCFRQLKMQLVQLDPYPHLVMKFLNGDQLLHPKLNADAKLRVKRAKRTYFRERNKMVKANLRLVFTVAARYRYLGLSYDDLVQEGNLGLIKAIEYFDASKGYRFSTYAYRVISQAIHASIEKQGELVRKPFVMYREKQRTDNMLNKMEQQLGRAISSTEVAEQMAAHPKFIAAILGRHSAMSADDHEQTNHYPHETDLATPESYKPEPMYTDASSIDLFLGELPQRERDMIIMRYGIGLRKDYTLEEISQQFGLSRERVRQLINAGLSEVKDQYFNDL